MGIMPYRVPAHRYDLGLVVRGTQVSGPQVGLFTECLAWCSNTGGLAKAPQRCKSGKPGCGKSRPECGKPGPKSKKPACPHLGSWPLLVCVCPVAISFSSVDRLATDRTLRRS